MSEQIEAVEEPVVDYKALYEEALEKTKNFDAVVAKKDELLKETKAAKEAKRLAEEERAKAAGEYEKLYKETEEALRQERALVRQEKVENYAARLAYELAEGDNAEILQDFIARKIAAEADERGALDKNQLAAIREEFEKGNKFKALLKGIKSVGGGAVGNLQRASNQATMNRQDFEALSQTERGKFFKSGGKLVD
jgi:transcriptional regulator NrdR family protein